MLKSIDPLPNGQLLAILDDMGHGNEIVIADANFGAAGIARRLVDLPGATATELVDAILAVFPLDGFVDDPMAVMTAPPGKRPMHDAFQAGAGKVEGRAVRICEIEPAEFVERARQVCAVTASGERRLYGNVPLRKGVLRP